MAPGAEQPLPRRGNWLILIGGTTADSMTQGLLRPLMRQLVSTGMLLAASQVSCMLASPTPVQLPLPGKPQSPRVENSVVLPFRTHRVQYAGEPSQFAELRVPLGEGPHPVVVLVHGGWWKLEFGSLPPRGQPIAMAVALLPSVLKNSSKREIPPDDIDQQAKLEQT